MDSSKGGHVERSLHPFELTSHLGPFLQAHHTDDPQHWSHRHCAWIAGINHISRRATIAPSKTGSVPAPATRRPAAGMTLGTANRGHISRAPTGFEQDMDVEMLIAVPTIPSPAYTPRALPGEAIPPSPAYSQQDPALPSPFLVRPTTVPPYSPLTLPAGASRARYQGHQT